jgi:hypothetical protein
MILLYLVILLFGNETVWPLPEKTGLLSSFGEWRDGHLHAGIDLPTKGIGEKAYSVSDGWVLRVRTSPFGYGKAIYIKSWTGEIYVYGHLSSFSRNVEKIVRKEQLRILSYETDIWLKEAEVKVNKGEVIGYTGRSGCSSPHLHFELRDKTNNPMDPFIRGFSVPDTVSPIIEAIRLVPLDETSTVGGSHIGKIFKYPKDTISVFVEGKIGVEIEIVDKVNTNSGRLGSKEIRLLKDNKLIRREFIDKFSYVNYTDSRFLFDFVSQMRTGRKFRRLFAFPGNDFPFYEGNDGIIEGKKRDVYSIEVYDCAWNVAYLYLKFLDSLGKKEIEPDDLSEKSLHFETNGFLVYGKWFDLRKLTPVLKSGDSIMVWNLTKSDFLKLRSPDGKCQILLPSDGKTQTKVIAVKVNKSKPKIWCWEPPIPFKKKTKIKIKVPVEEKFSSIYEKKDNKWTFYSSRREGKYLVSSIDHLGTFGVLKDTVTPGVSLKRNSFSSKIPLEIEVWDSLSGVDFSSIRTFIDGKQTVFAYEPERKRLIFEYPEEIAKGEHLLKLSLSDKERNKTSKEWNIVKK